MVDQNRTAELREAIELLFFSYREFTAGPDRILLKRGLNRIHHRILYFVGKAPAGSVSDLLAVLRISKQALHAPLRQLVSMGLISNEKAPQDGRVRELRLTTDGRELESTLSGIQMRQLQAVFDGEEHSAEGAWRRIMVALATR